MDIATLLNEHSIDLASYSEVSIESGRAPITLSIWEAEQDTAPTVVFVPGTMTHPLFYSPFLDAVSRHGYHVVGVHPLSHGRSPRVVRRFTLDDMIGNVRDAVGYACARFPGAVGLMGSSQGGVLTLLAAGGEHRIRAAFPHNVLFTPLRESLSVTRFPNALGVVYPVIRRIIAVAGRVMPGLQVSMRGAIWARVVMGFLPRAFIPSWTTYLMRAKQPHVTPSMLESQMRKDVHDVSVRIPKEETTHSPLLHSEIMHDLPAVLPSNPIGVIEIIHLDGNHRVDRSSGVRGDQADLDGTISWRGQGGDPAMIHDHLHPGEATVRCDGGIKIVHSDQWHGPPCRHGYHSHTTGTRHGLLSVEREMEYLFHAPTVHDDVTFSHPVSHG